MGSSGNQEGTGSLRDPEVERLIGELDAELARRPPDFSRVLSLSTAMAKLDPEHVRFSADAGLISRLGYELVSRQETALAELVKNAYDADATSVDLVFRRAIEPGGTLEITDKGTGMTRADLIDGFMRLSSPSKVREPVSPRHLRRRAGRKGIGRFAVQRLGRRLTITTKTLSEKRALRVEIDWDQFEVGRELSSIASRIDEIEWEQEEGTSLLIEDLRDGWSDAQLLRAFRSVAQLLQPFPLSKRTERSVIDPGFQFQIYRDTGSDLVIVADEDTQIFSHAAAKIEGVIDEAGRGYWSIVSRAFPQIDEDIVPIGAYPDDPAEPFEHLRDIYVRAYYFIYQAGLLPRSMDKVIRELANERGGIKVYRNGFRVLPYGESDNDWLGLEEITARRRLLFPIANINFFGFIEIVDPEGEVFEETSSRERVVENEAFMELRSFVQRVLRAAANRVNEQREVKRFASGREAEIETPSIERIREAARRIREAVLEREASSGPDGRAEISLVVEAENIERGVVALEQLRQMLLDELGMLRVLASLGMVIGEFTHEVDQTLGAADIDAQTLAESLAGSPEQPLAQRLLNNVRRFESYASYFDRTVRENVDRELRPIELGDAILSFVEVVGPSTKRKGTTMSADVLRLDLFTCPAHPSEIDSVLFNFHTNALKAIRRARRDGTILVRAGREADRVFIEFADNGDGIPIEIRDRIFNPFFTTSTPGGGSLDADDDLRGSGLGLKIVRDIATGYGGEVELVTPPDGYSTCFRFELPIATEETLSDAL